VRFEKIDCDDADYLLVAYGTSARICQKVQKLGREKGIKIGLLRPITLWPFPSKELNKLGSQVKGILSVEMSAGQMIEDVKLAVEGKTKVEHYGRFGGMIPSPDEVLNALEEKLIKN
jgi:2-oxoglutarate ferredoxin oxidoreductase subunit alpha